MSDDDKENLDRAIEVAAGSQVSYTYDHKAKSSRSDVYEITKFTICEQTSFRVPTVQSQYTSKQMSFNMSRESKEDSLNVVTDKIQNIKYPNSKTTPTEIGSLPTKEISPSRNHRSAERKSLEPDNFSNSNSAISERLLMASRWLGQPQRVPLAKLTSDDDDDDEDDEDEDEDDDDDVDGGNDVISDAYDKGESAPSDKLTIKEQSPPLLENVASAVSIQHTSISATPREDNCISSIEQIREYAKPPINQAKTIVRDERTSNFNSSSQGQNKIVDRSNTLRNTQTPLPSSQSQSQHTLTPINTALHPTLYQLPQPIFEVLVINNRSYYVLSLLGRGGFSQVQLVYDTQRKCELAVKCVNLQMDDEMMSSAYMNEIDLLQKLQHSDRVIKLYDYEFNHGKNCLYVVMEKGDTDLASLIRTSAKSKQITAEMIKFYWSEMLRTVAVIHKEGIIHSDLKPANFVLVAGRVKLIDFGIATSVQNDMTSVIKDVYLGTFNYMSPEAIRDTAQAPEFDDSGKRKPLFKINFKSDVWSLGCILYCLVYGKTPFQDVKNNLAKLHAITSEKHRINFPEIENKHLMDVMKKCLLREQKLRLSIDELLQHPYLTTEDKPSVDSIVRQMTALTPNRFSQVEEQVKKLLARKKSDTNQ